MTGLWYANLALSIVLPVFAAITAVWRDRKDDERVRGLLEEGERGASKQMPFHERLFVYLLIAMVIGGFLIALPAALASFSDVLSAALDAVHSTLYMTTLKFSASTIYSAIANAFADNYIARVLYMSVAELYSILLPVVMTASAVSIISQRLPYMQLRHAAWRHSSGDIFVFHEINKRSVALASDVLRRAKRDSQDAVVVFSNCNKDEKNKHTAEINSLKSLGDAAVITVYEAMENMPPLVEKFQEKHYCLFSDVPGENISSAISVVDSVLDYIKSKSLEKADAEKIARSNHVYCLHGSPDGDLIIDSMGRDYDSETQMLRKQIEFRLISEVEERVRDVLINEPLFDVLDPPQRDERGNITGQKQDLYVVVVGMGRIGIETVRTVFWLGRLENVRLHLISIDKSNGLTARKLEALYPEMMSEKNGVVCGGTLSDSTVESSFPTVRMVEADVTTNDLERILSEIPANARPYVLISLGDDSLNYSIAMRVRRHFEERLLPEIDQRHLAKIPVCDGGFGASVPAGKAKIVFCVENPGARSALASLSTDKNEAFEFVPFGDTTEVFSYENIIAARWERIAVNVSGIYDMVNAFSNGDVDFESRMLNEEVISNFNGQEIKKASNRACALHIPYRFWSIGLGCGRVDGKTVVVDLEGGNAIEGWHDWLNVIGVSGTPEEQIEQVRYIVSDLGCGQRYAELEASYPIVWNMAKIEHDRWCAFYQANGWSGLSIEGVSAIRNRYFADSPKKEHQSSLLRKHVYVCSFDDMVTMGKQIAEMDGLSSDDGMHGDINVYDRVLVIGSYKALLEEVLG